MFFRKKNGSKTRERERGNKPLFYYDVSFDLSVRENTHARTHTHTHAQDTQNTKTNKFITLVVVPNQLLNVTVYYISITQNGLLYFVVIAKNSRLSVSKSCVLSRCALGNKWREMDSQARARLNTYLDVRAFQSNHGHGRTTDISGAYAANF